MTTTRIAGPQVSVVCTDPTTPAVGDAVRLAKAVGVALGAERADGTTSVDFGDGVYELLVDDSETTGIAAGDPLYYHDAQTGTPATSVNNSAAAADAFVGFALEAISANGTERIKVLRTAAAAII